MTTTISPALGEGRDVTLFDLVLRNSEDALDAYKGSLHVVDRHGFSAVMVAAMHRCPVALRWLVRAGAGRSGVDRKEWTQSLTALMFACIGWAVAPAAGSCLDDPTCASILIEAGANPLHQNANGDTALHWAVHSGFVRVAAYLASLEYVVDAAGGRPASDMLTIRNAKGELPADVAGTREGSLEVANALRAALEGRGGGALVVPAVAVSEFASRARSLEPRLKLKKPTGEVVTATVGEYLGACARRGDVIALGKFPLYLDAVDLDGRVLLHAACTQRREDVVQWYLDTAPAARTQLAARDDMSCTCMHFAAAKGSRGADVDADPRCMQLVAAAGADLNAVDNTGGTPLHVAAQNGFGAIVRFLCGLPACALAVVDVHGRSAAASARLAGFHDVAAIIEAEAARRDRQDRQRAGTSTLHELAVDGDVPGMQAFRGDMDARDACGHTALMAAARARSVAGVKWLIDNCSCAHLEAVNRLDGRKTALMYACEAGPENDRDAARVVAVLLAAFVDPGLVNKQAASGDTALHLACRTGSRAVVERLFQYASRVLEAGIRNTDGHTAADVATTPALREYVTRADFKAFVTRCRAAQEAAGRQVHAAGAADGAAAAAMTVCPYSDCEIVDMLLGPLCAVVGRRAWTDLGPCNGAVPDEFLRPVGVGGAQCRFETAGRWLAAGVEACIVETADRQAGVKVDADPDPDPSTVSKRLVEVDAREKRVAEREAKAAVRAKKFQAEASAFKLRVEAWEAEHARAREGVLNAQSQARAAADAAAAAQELARAERCQLAVDIQSVRALHATYSERVSALADALHSAAGAANGAFV